MTETTNIESLTEAIIQVLEEFPNLKPSGFTWDQKRGEQNICGKCIFFEWIPQIRDVMEFLKPIKKLKNVGKYGHSYGYKHNVERVMPNGYLPNGVFILGAILSGFKVYNISDLNCQFNISWRAMEKRELAIKKEGK